MKNNTSGKVNFNVKNVRKLKQISRHPRFTSHTRLRYFYLIFSTFILPRKLSSKYTFFFIFLALHYFIWGFWDVFRFWIFWTFFRIVGILKRFSKNVQNFKNSDKILKIMFRKWSKNEKKKIYEKKKTIPEKQNVKSERHVQKYETHRLTLEYEFTVFKCA